MKSTRNAEYECLILGCGAWGPGFSSWDELSTLLCTSQAHDLHFSNPAPAVIPANERRRAPLIVKMAVETSGQAIANSNLSPQEIACVFGSGLGDTDITDYLCRALLTELKQLSPTKFHNSVHNTAAGYWTISTHCMEAANSIAAYTHTAGMIMLEAVCQCIEQQRPVLITLYDMEVHKVLTDLFPCQHNISLSLVVAPPGFQTATALKLRMRIDGEITQLSPLNNSALEQMRAHNPTGQLLSLMEIIAHSQHGNEQRERTTQLSISPNTSIAFELET